MFERAARPRTSHGWTASSLGFHLGEPRTQVLEEVQRRGIPLECIGDESFQPYCTEGSTPPAGTPVLSMCPKDEHLVSLARSVTRERGYPHATDWEAQYLV